MVLTKEKVAPKFLKAIPTSITVDVSEATEPLIFYSPQVEKIEGEKVEISASSLNLDFSSIVRFSRNQSIAISIEPMKARASLESDNDMKVVVKLTDSSSLSTSYETTFKIVISVATNSTANKTLETTSSNDTASINDTETTDESTKEGVESGSTETASKSSNSKFNPGTNKKGPSNRRGSLDILAKGYNSNRKNFKRSKVGEII